MNEHTRVPSNEPIGPTLASQKPSRRIYLFIFGSVLTLILLVAVLTEIYRPRPSAADHEASGRSHLSQGALDSAISEFDKAIRLDPNLASAYDARGQAYEEKDDLRRAVADFDRAIALKEDFAEAFHHRGRAYYFLGNYDRTIADCSQAIALDPMLTEAYFRRGVAYIRLKDYTHAIADYDQVIAQDPESAAGYSNRCWSNYMLGRYEQALPDCEKSLELEPDDVDALDSRARVYQGLGRLEEAKADFNRIIALGASAELSQAAREELEDIASVEIVNAPVGTNLAHSKPATVSRALSDRPASMAVDGNPDTWWGSGALAPQWITIDLGANYTIAEIRLFTSQSPAGKTIHRLLVKGAATENEFKLVHTFDGETQDSSWLSFRPEEPLRGVRYVQIETTSSPSWISWREIEAIAGE